MKVGDLVIDDIEIAESFVRVSGPGGQNVNKVGKGAELRFDARVNLDRVASFEASPRPRQFLSRDAKPPLTPLFPQAVSCKRSGSRG